jgi:hypothetical protein
MSMAPSYFTNELFSKNKKTSIHAGFKVVGTILLIKKIWC